MDNIKKIIVIIVIIALILSIIILSLLLSSLDEIDSVVGDETNYEDYQEEYVTENKVEKVSNKNIYYAVVNIIDNYISYITNKDIDALQQIFAFDYRNEFDVNKDNIISKVSSFSNDEIYIENMSELQISESISIVIVDGKTKTNSTQFNIIVKLDSLNKAYEIYPEEYLNKHGYNDLEKIPTLNKIDTTDVVPNTYNTFSFKNITNLEMCKYYLEDYIYNVTTNIEKAYELLDEEYRTNRIGSLEAYKTYVNSNLENIKNIKLDEYTTVKYDDYKQYVCIDTEGKYYLFRETAIMEYTLLLDTYTVILPEFIEKYNSASTAEKVALNINNFIQAINDKNYNYAYKVLNENFKNNKFSNQALFETYVQNNLFEKNIIKFGEYTVQNNTYIYTAEINDGNSNKINMTFIMELGYGTDFSMSFSIN